MAREPFLINPPKRRKHVVRKRTVSFLGNSRRKRTTRKKLSNFWEGHIPEHRTAARKGWTKRKRLVKGYRAIRGAHYPLVKTKNPFGEEVVVMGLNPHEKRHGHRRRLFAAVRNPHRRKHAVHHRRRSNPAVRRYHRRHGVRSNPIEMSLRNPQSLVIPILAGLGAKIALDKVPAMLNLNTSMSKLGAQLVIAVGGSILLRKVNKDASAAFGLVSGVLIASKLMDTYIPMSGLGAFIPEAVVPKGLPRPTVGPSMGMSGVGMFPSAMDNPFNPYQ